MVACATARASAKLPTPQQVRLDSGRAARIMANRRSSQVGGIHQIDSLQPMPDRGNGCTFIVTDPGDMNGRPRRGPQPALHSGYQCLAQEVARLGGNCRIPSDGQIWFAGNKLCQPFTRLGQVRRTVATGGACVDPHVHGRAPHLRRAGVQVHGAECVRAAHRPHLALMAAHCTRHVFKIDGCHAVFPG